MDLYQVIKSQLADFDKLIETPILDSKKKILGWHSTILLRNGTPFSGGTNANRETARRIAVAEAIERVCISRFRANKFTGAGFDEIPFSSGFAAGFNRQQTAFRSICEGVERWIWSKWIDSGFVVSEVDGKNLKSAALATYFLEQFESVRFFEAEVLLPREIDVAGSLVFSAVVGFRDNGAFPGSRVSLKDDDRWTHGLIEAHRHLQLYRSLIEDRNYHIGYDWYLDRVFYFGSHREDAEKYLSSASQSKPFKPEKWLHTELSTGVPDVFLYRTLFKDFIPWHVGGQNRFLY